MEVCFPYSALFRLLVGSPLIYCADLYLVLPPANAEGGISQVPLGWIRRRYIKNKVRKNAEAMINKTGRHEKRLGLGTGLA